MGCGGSRGAHDAEDAVSVPVWKKRYSLDGRGLSSLPHLKNIKHIETVTLANNKLTTLSGLASRMESWEALTDLNLSRNMFEAVPKQLAQLKSLKSLNLSSNPISDSKSFEVIGRCKNLRKLDLSDLSLCLIPPWVLEGGAHITHLSLSFNARIQIHSSILALQRLERLDISRSFMTSVPSVIASLPRLTSLNLSYNPLLDHSLAILKGCAALRTLELAGIVGWGCAIPQQLCELESVTELTLSMHNYVTYAPLKALPNLESLDISSSWQSTLTGLNELRTLRRLDLSNNALVDIKASSLPPSLTALNICSNPFTKSVRAAAPAWQSLAEAKGLLDISFQSWGGRGNVNPYTTKIPLPLLRLPLERINGVSLNPKFTADPGQNMVNILKGAYFKPDMGVDWDTRLTLHIKLIARFVEYFDDLTVAPEVTAIRYRMFLHMQHSVVDKKFIAPLDVALYHYVHMRHPDAYRADCLDMFGAIVDNFYHGVDRSTPAFQDYSRVVESRAAWTDRYGDRGALCYDFPFCEPGTADREHKGEVGCVPQTLCMAAVGRKLPERVATHKLRVNIQEELPKLVGSLQAATDYAPVVTRYAAAAVARFYKFIALQALRRGHPTDDSSQPITVTPALALSVHTFQCMPSIYDTTTRHILGPCNVVSVLDKPHSPPLSCGKPRQLDQICELWQKVWGTDFMKSNDPVQLRLNVDGDQPLKINVGEASMMMDDNVSPFCEDTPKISCPPEIDAWKALSGRYPLHSPDTESPMTNTPPLVDLTVQRGVPMGPRGIIRARAARGNARDRDLPSPATEMRTAVSCTTTPNPLCTSRSNRTDTDTVMASMSTAAESIFELEVMASMDSAAGAQQQQVPCVRFSESIGV